MDSGTSRPARAQETAHSMGQQKRRLGPIPEAHIKRQKFQENPPTATMPAQVWQQIFQYLPPETLAQLVWVNHAFKDYLTNDEWDYSSRPLDGASQFMNPEHIWATSRSIYHPSLPKALAGCKELQMWGLIKGKNCCLCGSRQHVMVIWPFAVRLCVDCLGKQTQSESSLLFSSTSAILPALPFAFITKSNEVVSSIALQNPRDVPLDLEIRKVYYTPHIEKIQYELDVARTIGSAVAEERFNAMKSRQEARMRGTQDWERWQSVDSGRIYSPIITRPRTLAIAVRPSNASTIPNLSNLPPAQHDKSPRISSRPSSLTHAVGPFQPVTNIRPQHRAGRSVTDLNEVKAVRRAEIEKRCRELNPPLLPQVLQHIDSFHAALQISSELTENAWNVLKPRLVAQQRKAEQREREREANEQAMNATLEDRRRHEISLREFKEVSDREWEQTQTPVRERIASYADEVIRNTWADGQIVDSNTSPQFAAEVLLYVRKRFYSDLARENSSSQTPDGKTQLDSTKPLPIRRLVLDNMKWVYDMKIRPLTEQHCKESFLCNGAGCEANLKYFDFHGVIQHYAAKHTNAFSVASVVVHWHQAEWPEQPPFVPDPTARKALLQRSNPTPGPGQVSQFLNPQRTSTHGSFPASFPGPLGAQGMPMMSPGPYVQPGVPNQYAMGPFIPPNSVHLHQEQLTVQQQLHHNLSSSQVNPVGFPAPAFTSYMGATSPFEDHNHYPGPAPQGPLPSHGGWTVPPYGQSHSSAYPRGPAMYSNPDYGQVRAHSVGPLAAFPMRTHPAPTLYQSQIDLVANIARNMWSATSGIKALDQGVRMYVIIHHVISRFRVRFSNEPTLDLFTESLINHPLMEPFKTANGLACKACVANDEGHEDLHSHSFPLTSGGRKLHPFLSLLVHFKTWHVERNLASDSHIRPDWKEDMLELPDDRLIAHLANVPGMDDVKLQVFADIFPNIFRVQLADQGSEASENWTEARYVPISDHRGRGDARASRTGLHTTHGQAGSSSLVYRSDGLSISGSSASRFDPDFGEAREDELQLRKLAFFEPGNRQNSRPEWQPRPDGLVSRPDEETRTMNYSPENRGLHRVCETLRLHNMHELDTDTQEQTSRSSRRTFDHPGLQTKAESPKFPQNIDRDRSHGPQSRMSREPTVAGQEDTAEHFLANFQPTSGLDTRVREAESDRLQGMDTQEQWNSMAERRSARPNVRLVAAPQKRGIERERTYEYVDESPAAAGAERCIIVDGTHHFQDYNTRPSMHYIDQHEIRTGRPYSVNPVMSRDRRGTYYSDHSDQEAQYRYYDGAVEEPVEYVYVRRPSNLQRSQITRDREHWDEDIGDNDDIEYKAYDRDERGSMRKDERQPVYTAHPAHPRTTDTAPRGGRTRH